MILLIKHQCFTECCPEALLLARNTAFGCLHPEATWGSLDDSCVQALVWRGRRERLLDQLLAYMDACTAFLSKLSHLLVGAIQFPHAKPRHAKTDKPSAAFLHCSKPAEYIESCGLCQAADAEPGAAAAHALKDLYSRCMVTGTGRLSSAATCRACLVINCLPSAKTPALQATARHTPGGVFWHCKSNVAGLGSAAKASVQDIAVTAHPQGKGTGIAA